MGCLDPTVAAQQAALDSQGYLDYLDPKEAIETVVQVNLGFLDPTVAAQQAASDLLGYLDFSEPKEVDLTNL